MVACQEHCLYSYESRNIFGGRSDKTLSKKTTAKKCHEINSLIGERGNDCFFLNIWNTIKLCLASVTNSKAFMILQ